jgi:hypothetical protein
MVFKEKKEISQIWDKISRAVFSFLRILSSSRSVPAYQPQVKVDQYPAI